MTKPGRPDRYEQELTKLLVKTDNDAAEYPQLSRFVERRETIDEVLRLYRAVQFGEYTERGAALAEYRAKAVQHAGT